MSLLEISQIIFNLVTSLALAVVAVLISTIAYKIIKLSKAVKYFFEEVNKESLELYNKIGRFLESITNLRFFSKFFNKKDRRKTK